MASLAEFIRGVLADGRVVVRGRPEVDLADVREAIVTLQAAFADHRLDVAGPPIAFDPVSAAAAADLVRQACWFLVARDEPAEVLAARLSIPQAPRSASEHLSSDLMLRFLPRVDRSARALAPADPLAKVLADVFRRFPLSGVLSDLGEGPGDPGDLGGHPGLRLLYAERLGGADRLAWAPAPGSAAAEAVALLAARAARVRAARSEAW